MAGNSFGSVFKLTTFGESHGIAIGGGQVSKSASKTLLVSARNSLASKKGR